MTEQQGIIDEAHGEAAMDEGHATETTHSPLQQAPATRQVLVPHGDATMDEGHATETMRAPLQQVPATGQVLVPVAGVQTAGFYFIGSQTLPLRTINDHDPLYHMPAVQAASNSVPLFLLHNRTSPLLRWWTPGVASPYAPARYDGIYSMCHLPVDCTEDGNRAFDSLHSNDMAVGDDGELHPIAVPLVNETFPVEQSIIQTQEQQMQMWNIWEETMGLTAVSSNCSNVDLAHPLLSVDFGEALAHPYRYCGDFSLWETTSRTPSDRKTASEPPFFNNLELPNVPHQLMRNTQFQRRYQMISHMTAQIQAERTRQAEERQKLDFQKEQIQKAQEQVEDTKMLADELERAKDDLEQLTERAKHQEAEKETIISQLTEELENSRLENEALKEEVRLLKAKLAA